MYPGGSPSAAGKAVASSAPVVPAIGSSMRSRVVGADALVGKSDLGIPVGIPVGSFGLGMPAGVGGMLVIWVLLLLPDSVRVH